jgi:serine/threonine protein phosphatase PrpC
MVVTCPTCGQSTHDLEFCDHCNADLNPDAAAAPTSDQPLPEQAELRLGRHLLAMLNRPEAGVVVSEGGRHWRVHWIPATQWPEWSESLGRRQQFVAASLPPCRTTTEAEGVWVTVEAKATCATPWLVARGKHPLEQLRLLLEILGPLTAALEGLHGQGLVCLPFDPRCLEVVEVGPAVTVRFTNLDLSVCPSGPCPDRLQVLPSFASPEVSRYLGHEVGPAVDVYHTALFAYYWLAGLLPHGFTGAGLEAFDHDIPTLRNYAPNLVPGVAEVLLRGLAPDPRERWTTPTALVDALRDALERARRRWQSTDPIVWDVGGHTRTGRAKEALHRANEDDIMVRQFSDPDRDLLAVVDGLTSCSVGSGGLASLLTILALENTLGDDCTAEDFPDRVAKACRHGSESILAWAVEHGYRRSLLHGEDLMASTLLAGWLEGRTLTLGNLGDSRAYLIADGRVEQLTVDGDVRSFWLGRGIPPEEVGQLGGMGRSLRCCVGGFVADSLGEPAIDPEHLRPAVSTWPLLPGDVVVLCTDGLVEEGVFLEPPDLVRLVGEHPDLEALSLAEFLVEAADSLQELPSPERPDGFGDNISCVVIKVYTPEPPAGAP